MMWIHSKEGNLINLAHASAVVVRHHKTKDAVFELVVIFPGVASSPSGIPISDQHSLFEGSKHEVTMVKAKLSLNLAAGHLEGVTLAEGVQS